MSVEERVNEVTGEVVEYCSYSKNEMIEVLIHQELMEGLAKWGGHHSTHEGYAVLLEEVEEAEEEMVKVKERLDSFWWLIRSNFPAEQLDTSWLKEAGVNLIKEAVQVCAMADKLQICVNQIREKNAIADANAEKERLAEWEAVDGRANRCNN